MVKNLLKKGCLVVSVLLGLGSNVQAQETSVTFNVSDEGKTLTISGQGDLTTYQTTDFSARVFSDKAVGYVFTDDKGTKVNAGDSYSANNIYYQANYEYTKVCDGEPTGWNGPFGQVTSNKTWKEDKITNLYKGYYSPYNTSVVLQSKVKVGDGVSANAWNNDQYSDMSVYFLSSEELSGEKIVSLSELESQGVTLISKVELQKYYESNVTYTMRADAFKSSDGGKTYTGLTNGETYTWTPGEVFYTGTATFSQIEDNGAFFGTRDTEGLHSDYIKADETPYTFAQLLQKKIASGSYETVKFNKTSSEDLLINNDIVSKILFITETNDWWTKISYNVNLKTLDLGAATCTDFSKETFAANGAHGYPALETLTLPLNESKETPANVVSYLQGQNFKLTHVIVPEGYEKIGANTFETGAGVNLLTNVTLPNSLTEIGEKAFFNAGNLASIELGANLTYIGKEAFMGTGLTSISFPENLDKIDDGAFYDLNIANLVFNEKLRFIGNSAFALPSEQTETVLMIPASVKYIGPFAFNFRQYQDVYFQGTKAPLMPVGKAIFHSDWGEGTAFSAHTLMGNSGFNPASGDLRDDAYGEGFANRENYKSSTGVYFCIMHYPSSTSDEDAKDFTDTSRTYETCPEGGKWDHANTPLTVGKEGADPEFKAGMPNASYNGIKVDYGYQDTYLGRQYIWPSQIQWVRSYIVNSYGYNWDGVTKYRSKLTEEDYATLKEAGFVADTDGGQYTKDELCKIAHMGTRRFVLVDDDSRSTPDYKIMMKPGQWWTLCVPFNMTKKQVLDTFGADTQLCLFNKVTRDLGVNGKNKIVLYFTQDVLNHSTKNADGTKMKDANGMWSADIATAKDNVANDDVVLWAHESYMIKPYNGEQSNQDAVFVVKKYEAVEGDPLPTVVESTTAVQSRQASKTKKYRFVGNYLGDENARATKETIPQYSYVYANTKSDPVYKFRFYTGNTSTWKPNKSLVQTCDRNGGMDDYNNFFGIDKSTPLPAGSKQASVFGGENFGETTGIEDVTIVAGTDTLTPVFNLEGKMVSSNGDAAGLPAGIYVKNGQKFMVK